MDTWVEEGVAGGKDVDLKKFNELISKRKEQKTCYETKKAESAAEYKILDEMDKKLVSYLKDARLTKFVGSDGTISTRIGYSYKVPKDSAAKQCLFGFIRQTDGEDVLDSLLTINSRTLNTYCKSKMEEADEKGELDFKIEGLEDPKMNVTLAFTKAKA